VGLAGLAANHRLSASRVTLTDTNAKVLENLKQNASILPRHEAIEIRCLEWQDMDQVRSFGPYDFIIAADCVYDPHDVPAFVQVLRYFLEANSKSYVLLACTV